MPERDVGQGRSAKGVGRGSEFRTVLMHTGMVREDPQPYEGQPVGKTRVDIGFAFFRCSLHIYIDRNHGVSAPACSNRTAFRGLCLGRRDHPREAAAMSGGAPIPTCV